MHAARKALMKPAEACHAIPYQTQHRHLGLPPTNQFTHLMIIKSINCTRCLNAAGSFLACLHPSNHQLLLPATLKQQPGHTTFPGNYFIQQGADACMQRAKSKSWPLDHVWHFGGAFECTSTTFLAAGREDCKFLSSVMKERKKPCEQEKIHGFLSAVSS